MELNGLPLTATKYYFRMAHRYLAELCRPVANIDGQQHLQSAGHCQLDVPHVRLSAYGGHTFGYAGPSAWNTLPDFLKTVHFLTLLLDVSLNISASHITSTLSAFVVILTCYINYLLTY